MRSHVGALRSGLRTLPFRWQLIVLLGGFLLITSIVLAGLAYRTSRQIIEREAIRAVGLVADGREQVLVRILHRHHDRALNFLRAARAFCKTSRPAAACLRRLLEEFQRTERATGARFELPDMPPISVGNPIRTISSLHRERPGRIAWFNVTEAPHYLIAAEAESPRSAVALSFDVGEIHAIFLDRQGLGQTEETFLTDPEGLFITPPKHSSDSGQSHPINAEPMRLCLAGRNGEMLDLDYGERHVVHGFRFIEEIGGGCIMAHIQQAEAFAPARALARELLAVSGGFLLIGIGSALFLGRLLSKPIDRLTDRVRALESGDFSSPVPVEGPLEIQAFAKTFEAMAHSLSLSRRALVESEARTRAIVEHTLNAVVTINADGIITDWNRQAEIQFGWSKAEAMGQPMAALIIPPSYRDSHAAGLQRFLQTGEGRILDRQVELTALRRNGEEFPVELAVTAIRMGTSYLFTAFIFDITERKRAEEGLREKQEQLVQAAKLASIGELATGVAHELNNPLNNINLFVGNIQDRMRLGIMATETLAKDLERVSQQVQKAAAIVDHLRTFGRGAPVTREPVSINDVLTSALSLVREQFRLREIDVALELAPSAPTVLGNAIQLEQVFVNLLGNAHDSVAELPTKTVTVRSIAHSDLVEVTVQDTGMGMSQEVQRRLFDPFFTTKPVGRGTGLGLSIAYGIIQDHQGVIDVDSAPGHGATFTIHLPLLQND